MDQEAGAEVEEVGEPVLVGTKGGYTDDLHSIVPDLWEQGDGWEGVIEFGGPGQEKGIVLGTQPEGSYRTEEVQLVICGSRELVPAQCAPLAKDRAQHGIM